MKLAPLLSRAAPQNGKTPRQSRRVCDDAGPATAHLSEGNGARGQRKLTFLRAFERATRQIVPVAPQFFFSRPQFSDCGLYSSDDGRGALDHGLRSVGKSPPPGSVAGFVVQGNLSFAR
jgi:hypothetical protein